MPILYDGKDSVCESDGMDSCIRNGGHRLRTAELLCGILLVLGACSSGDEPISGALEAPEDHSVEVTSSSSSSTSPTTTSTSTTTPTAVVAEAEAKPLIEIPTEWANMQAEVFGRYLLYWDALYIAFGAPGADADYEPFKELVYEEFIDDLQEQARDLQGDGVYLALPDGSITEHILRFPDGRVPEKTEGSQVIVQDCWVDDSEWRYLDGSLEEAVRRTMLRNVTMEVIDGEWRVRASVNASEESDGYEECASYLDQL